VRQALLATSVIFTGVMSPGSGLTMTRLPL